MSSMWRSSSNEVRMVWQLLSNWIWYSGAKTCHNQSRTTSHPIWPQCAPPVGIGLGGHPQEKWPSFRGSFKGYWSTAKVHRKSINQLRVDQLHTAARNMFFWRHSFPPQLCLLELTSRTRPPKWKASVQTQKSHEHGDEYDIRAGWHQMHQTICSHRPKRNGSQNPLASNGNPSKKQLPSWNSVYVEERNARISWQDPQWHWNRASSRTWLPFLPQLSVTKNPWCCHVDPSILYSLPRLLSQQNLANSKHPKPSGMDHQHGCSWQHVPSQSPWTGWLAWSCPQKPWERRKWYIVYQTKIDLVKL